MNHRHWLAWALLLISATASAQTLPATIPATRPATRSAPQRLIVPPGFRKVEIPPRLFVIEAVDEPWVRQTIEKLTPTTLPTTMPSDVTDRIASNAPALAKQIGHDLALDPSTAQTFLISELTPRIRKYVDFNPPLVYFITTRPKLKMLMKDGWTDPRFYYNRAADDVAINSGIRLSLDDVSDDVVLPLVFDDSTALDVRRQLLTDLTHVAETQIAQRVATQALVEMQGALIEFMVKQVLNPLKLTTEQEWFSAGVVGVLSARYVAQVSGIDAKALLAGALADERGNPIRAATVDLAHRQPISEMRPAAVPAYFDAFRKKSARVVLAWIEKAGDEALPKTITALRVAPAADGPALLKLIQQTTGIDLTHELDPK